MGDMFRSEEMALCQLFIQPEAAYPSISELGEYGIVQFRDLNGDVNLFQRKFVNEVRRCDEMERKIRYIESELNKDDVTIPEAKEMPKAPNPREIIDLEANLEKTESEILELSQNAVNLKLNYLELTEMRHVLEKTQVFFTEQETAGGSAISDSLTRALIQEEGNAQQNAQQQAAGNRGRLGFVAGVVPRERVPAFERMLWRISRGNVFLRQAELDESLQDPNTGNEIRKTVFAAFFQGEELKSRVKKVCTGFRASLYPCANTSAERSDMLKGVRTRLEDLHLVLNQTQDHRQRVLSGVAKELQNWMIMVRKMKAIYHTLNMFNMDVTKKCLIGECWVPVEDLLTLRKALQDGGKACGSSIPSFLNVIETTEIPPTFNRLNRFTRCFQNLIDAYGISSYREVNPALYSIVTFPFLFSIMFGDLGHGLIMFLFGLYLVIYEKKLMKIKSNNEIWNIFFGGRYIILLMGLFSIYAGIIYNDVFSKSMNIFGSSWINGYNWTTINTNKELQLCPRKMYTQEPYVMGLDPIWQVAPDNKIMFLNSYKMKLSIIFGVIHMAFGVSLSIINHVHFRNYSSILLEFLPQFIFLVLLFGYMVALMFLKWVLYSAINDLPTSERCAPSVLITFINMLLFKGDQKPVEGCKEIYMFEGQAILQQILVFISLACIPVMLLGKPLYIMCLRKRKPSYLTVTSENGDVNQALEMQPEGEQQHHSPPSHASTAGNGHKEEEEEPMSEIFIHQAIHTIEYVLSTISHTASYLRLWALSLAHAQLSEVLWSMVLHLGLVYEDYYGGAILFAAFGIWATLTIAILVLMEGLSAFLHTLRLHWIEFMSKFFTGAGYGFQPYSFKNVLDEEEPTDG